MSSSSSKVKSFFPWEYDREISQDFFQGPGLYGLSCQDPYVSKIISRYILKNKSYQVKTADEISLEWFEDTIGGYDLFAMENIFLIMNGEELKNIDYLISENIDWGENYILILFNTEKKNFLKMSKVDPDKYLKISVPKSWHAEKLINFYLKSMKLNLNPRIVEYLAETIPLDSALLMNAIKTLFLHHTPEKPIDLALAKELISSRNLDYFQLADLWGEQRKSEFFEQLLPLLPFEDLMKFSLFMQGHLLKLVDPSYIEEKKSLSRYDQKIKSLSPRYSSRKWQDDVRIFAEIEIMAKQKSPALDGYLKNLKLSN